MVTTIIYIRKSVDAYLSAQVFSLSAFLISKTHIAAQKPRGRQQNAKVCGSKGPIFRILSSLSRPLVDNSKTAKVLTLILAQN